MGQVLGKGCVYLVERTVFDNREFRRRTETYSRFRKHFETWTDPEPVGFRQKSQVC